MKKAEWNRTIRRHHRAVRRRQIAVYRHNDGKNGYILAKDCNPFAAEYYLPYKCGKDFLA